MNACTHCCALWLGFLKPASRNCCFATIFPVHLCHWIQTRQYGIFRICRYQKKSPNTAKMARKTVSSALNDAKQPAPGVVHDAATAAALTTAPPVRSRSVSSSSVSAMSSAPPALSFKELQRLNAMQMEFFGFAGWLASTLLYGTLVTSPSHSIAC